MKPSRCLLLPLLFTFLACDPRTTEQPGPDPRLEAEVERTREALAAGPLKAPDTAVLAALVDAGELRWSRGFGKNEAGFEPGHVFAVPQMAPLVLAVGLERLADQGQPAESDLRRREMLALPEDQLATALAARVDQESGDGWRGFLQKEIFGPLAMTSAKLPPGDPPSLEASAEDLVALMVDLQKAHAGRTWRRLTQKRAQQLLAGDGSQRGLGFELGGQGQARYFLRRGRSGEVSFVFVGFVSSGNGAVIFGPSDEVVEGTLKVLAREFDWPTLRD